MLTQHQKLIHLVEAVSGYCSSLLVVVTHRHIVTTSYSGELKLWSGEGWKYEWGTQAPMAQQHHVRTSPKV